MPGYAAVFLAMAMTAIGLPLVGGFHFGILAMRGAFEANPVWADGPDWASSLNAAYMLWLYQRMFFGEIENEKNRLLPDLSGREWAYMMPLVIMCAVDWRLSRPFLRYIEKPGDCRRQSREADVSDSGPAGYHRNCTPTTTTTSAPIQVRPVQK
jgi:NADH-quinone oxidoreductase subunit M